MGHAGGGVVSEDITSTDLSGVGVVAIGRNEGDRLKRCLRSAVAATDRVVYVDSGSTDGSCDFARSLGVEVIDLDTSVPFTAARARNAGIARLTERWPDLAFVHVVDGDCEFAEGWFAHALAVVAGASADALALHLALGAQDNLRWIALLLPVHLALWATWRRSAAAA